MMLCRDELFPIVRSRRLHVRARVSNEVAHHVLFEVGLLSTRAAQKTVRSLLQTDYEVDAVIANALRSLERSMARNPRDLIIETTNRRSRRTSTSSVRKSVCFQPKP